MLTFGAKFTDEVSSGSSKTVASSSDKTTTGGIFHFAYHIPSRIIGIMEEFFYRLGYWVSWNPWKVIILSISISLSASTPVLYLEEETNYEKLWLSNAHEISTVSPEVEKIFPAEYVVDSVIIKSRNVLRPEVIQFMMKIHGGVQRLGQENVGTWESICVRRPILPRSDVLKERMKRSHSEDLTPALTLPVAAALMASHTTSNINQVNHTRLPSVIYNVSETSLKPSPVPPETGTSNTTPDLPGMRSPITLPLDSLSKEKPAEEPEDDDETEFRTEDYDYSEFQAINPQDIGNVFGSNQNDNIGASPQVDREGYCNLVNLMERNCLSLSLLDLWNHEEALELEFLTKEKILRKLNSIILMISRGFVNYTDLLGGITMDHTGRVVSAEATRMLWFVSKTRNNESEEEMTTEWEREFIAYFQTLEVPKDVQVFYQTSNSLSDLTNIHDIQGPALRLIIGYIALLIFVIAATSFRNRLQHRFYLSIAALISVVLSTLSSTGIGVALGLPYASAHMAAPFLLLGIGIDDMFVIVQCFDTAPDNVRMMSHQEQFATALRKAGVAITITSFTDITAFAIGCTTSIPFIRSFCIYTAIGIFFVYILQTTLFVAFFALDQRRVAKKRDACCCCFKLPKPWKTSTKSEKHFFGTFMKEYYAPFLIRPLTKVATVLITLVILVINILGLRHLQVDVRSEIFIPAGSYLREYLKTKDDYFPTGVKASVYFTNLSHSHNIHNIAEITQKLRAQVDYVEGVSCWTDDFLQWLQQLQSRDSNFGHQNFTIYNDFQFRDHLSLFLYTEKGFKYRRQFWFKQSHEPTCQNPAPEIAGSSIDFYHKTGEDPVKNEDNFFASYKRTREIVKSVTLEHGLNSSNVWLWGPEYPIRFANKVVKAEALPSLVSTMACIIVIIFLMIVSIPVSILVSITVIMNIVNVMGIISWWGLGINGSTLVALLLSIGLSVDYAAHIAHSFLTHSGPTEKRLTKTLAEMGPPVFNGAFSTFLVFCSIIGSSNMAFDRFYKVFISVTCLGIYHGLCFLPVVLCTLVPRKSECAALNNKDGVSNSSETTTDTSYCYKNPVFQGKGFAIFGVKPPT